MAGLGSRQIRPDIVAPQETTPGQARERAADLFGSGYHIVENPVQSEQPVDGVWASAHFGLMADLQVPEHPPGTWRDARARHIPTGPGHG